MFSRYPFLGAGEGGNAIAKARGLDDVMRLAPHLLLELRDGVRVVLIPQRQRHLTGVDAHLAVIPPQLLLRRCLVVVGEVAQEEDGQHGVAEAVPIHGPAQVVRDALEGVAQLFWVGLGRRKKAVVVKSVLRFWRVLGNLYPSEGEIRLHAV